MRSLQPPLPTGSVAKLDTRGRNDFRCHHARVDAHAVVRSIHRRPMHDATANAAVVKLQRALAALVDGRRSGHAYFRERVIRPQRAITAADAAVTVGDPTRWLVDLHADGAAVAGRFDHDAVSSSPPQSVAWTLYPSKRPAASRSRSYRLVSGNGGNQDSRQTIQLS